MNQDDRVGDQASDLASDSMKIDSRPHVGVHHIDQDLHGDVRWELCTPRRKPADTWMRNPVSIQDAEDLVPVEIEKVKWGEVSGHPDIVPQPSAHGDVRCQRRLGACDRDHQTFGLRLAD